MYKGDDKMYTRETIECVQGRRYDVYKGDYRMYTREAKGYTTSVLDLYACWWRVCYQRVLARLVFTSL